MVQYFYGAVINREHPFVDFGGLVVIQANAFICMELQIVCCCKTFYVIYFTNFFFNSSIIIMHAVQCYDLITWEIWNIFTVKKFGFHSAGLFTET